MAVSAFAQPNPINRRAVSIAGLAANPFTPNSIPGLAYWWVASDLPVGGTVTNWADRIQGLIWTNDVKAGFTTTTNSGLGVYFSGTARFTNSGTSSTHTSGGSAFVIVERTSMNKNFESILTDTGQGRFYGYDAFHAGSEVIYCDVNSNMGKVKTNNFMTLIASNVSGTAHVFYTNGVFVQSVPSGSSTFLKDITMLGDDTNSRQLIGYIQEIAIYTNTLTSGNATALDSYATNTYTYSP